jgi:hypothetical protein
VIFSRAVVALVNVVSILLTPESGTMANAAFTTIRITLTAVAPTESVAVNVSKYVPAGKVAATLRIA